MEAQRSNIRRQDIGALAGAAMPRIWPALTQPGARPAAGIEAAALAAAWSALRPGANSAQAPAPRTAPNVVGPATNGR